MHDKISQKLIGYRVKAARGAAKWTQDELAKQLGLNDRQTISDIENGKRMLKPEELLALSDLLEQDIEYFINPFAVVGEAQFSWRAATEVPKNTLDNFELKAGQWIGLLRWLREQRDTRPSVLKTALRLSEHSKYEDAIQCAEGLVSELNLGDIPAETLIDKIEQILDIPVLFVDTLEGDEGKSISGATCHLEKLSVILINRHESEGRRFYDLAHELFHALTWNMINPDHRESNSIEERSKTKRTEQLADNFASALLMPNNSLIKLIKDYNDINHLCEVAAKLKVAPVALSWRLFNLKLIDDKVRLNLSHQKQLPSTSNIPQRFSFSFVKMLHSALEHGGVSARKAAKAVGLGLGDLIELFSQYNLNAPYDL
jgi:Zn-dependent peptidase ImmA (M78 family)/transcriptional regulator with XRE-family HTH domain